MKSAKNVSPSRIAIVTPWFGRDLVGGAERQAWQIATRLANRGHRIEVLTTCCRSFFDDWTHNHHPEGLHVEEGVNIRRFATAHRDKSRFDSLNKRLLSIPRSQLRAGVSPVPRHIADTWSDHNINSPRLEAFLQHNAELYDAFLFMPYLYGPTLNGLPNVKAKAWLQPCLHDEAYAYLPDVQQTFFAARRLLFNSEGEQRLAARLYGPIAYTRGTVVGEGIERLELNEAVPLPQKIGSRKFLVCIGRRCPEKGTDTLVRAFSEYRRRNPASTLALVLAGPGEATYDLESSDIFDLGFVSSAEKSTLLARCTALCQPSSNESFSRILFEAWQMSKPVMVEGECLATSLAVEAAGGGWVLKESNAWQEAFSVVEKNPDNLVGRLGEAGRQYAMQTADWEQVVTRYEQLLAHRNRVSRWTPTLREVHQLLPNLSYGDAVSTHALLIRDELRARGIRSEIFVQAADASTAREASIFTSSSLAPSAGLVYHHSIGTELVEPAALHPGPKCLVYHNVTPPEFFNGYRPDFARLLREGREQLWSLARTFPLGAGVSPHNVRELVDFGFESTTLLPLPIGDNKWSAPANEDLMSRFQDGCENLLFVGRLSPNKRQDELVEFFGYYRKRRPRSRLILAGAIEPGDPYASTIRAAIRRHHIEDHVLVTGPINDEMLHALYRTASAFVCFSEHEGFCVPLIEAMWFDVPVIAFRSSAIPETLAGAGLILDAKDDFNHIANIVTRVVDDTDFRDEIITRQRQTRNRYLPGCSLPALKLILTAMERQVVK